MPKIEVFNPDYEIIYDAPKYIYLNGKYEVCGTCAGTGTTVNPSIDHYGITREQLDEDPDFEEAYFRGDYNVSCRTCKGNRVMLVIDEDNNSKELIDAYWQREREKYEYARERYNEMRAEGQEVFMADFGY